MNSKSFGFCLFAYLEIGMYWNFYKRRWWRIEILIDGCLDD